jgi:FkbM family methyltransferase
MLKTAIRKILTFSKIDLTKNLKYDRLTQKIMSQVISSNSNCVDVGCHKGEMLDLMLKYSPNGKHLAFEPIPSFFKKLVEKYDGVAKIYPHALSSEKGETTFQYVKNAPAYSGIKKRQYDVKNPEIEQIKVSLELLDDLVAEDFPVDFIKIDVEGAELGVLKGAKRTIKKNKPYVIFEFGLGASEFYGTKPEDIFNFLVVDCGLQIYNLSDFIKNKKALSLQEFDETYQNASEYYFIAH